MAQIKEFGGKNADVCFKLLAYSFFLCAFGFWCVPDLHEECLQPLQIASMLDRTCNFMKIIHVLGRLKITKNMNKEK